jgi:hypothetical protein
MRGSSDAERPRLSPDCFGVGSVARCGWVQKSGPIHVFDCDENCKACGVLLGSLVSMTQLATLPHLFPFTLTLLSEKITRIC